VHVRYKSLYISLASSVKQQGEMTKFCVVYEMWTTTAIFSYFHLELSAVVAYVAVARFESHCRTEQICTITNFFLLGVVLGVVVVVA